MFTKIVNESDFKAFEKVYRDSMGYHRRAKQFLEEGQHTSVVFNVGSVALESYLVALCMLYGVDPGNHNYGCLMDTAEMLVDFPEELNKEIRSLDMIFDICSLENYHYKEPDSSDLNGVLMMCEEVHKLFDQNMLLQLSEKFNH